MSLPKKDRKFQSGPGKAFPDTSNHGFAEVIANALHRDFGNTRGAVKIVAASTNSNQRAVKNWFLALNGPTGRHLVDLMRNSDQVLEAVLFMCGREELVINNRLLDARRILIKMLNLIGDLQQISAQRGEGAED